MGVLTRDLRDLVPRPEEDREDGDERLGDALRGRFAELNVDSVEAVRDLRER